MADDTGTTEVMDAPQDTVPWTMQTTSPTGVQETITGSRPRMPIAPPASMQGQARGMSVPDLGPIYNAAFQNLPIEQADKAIAAATQFIGQRGYMKDLESGMSAAQAMAKWGPMLFHNKPTGMATAIQNSAPPPITPQQQFQNQMAQKRFDLEQQKAQFAQQQASRKPAALTQAQHADLTDAYKELDQARRDAVKLNMPEGVATKGVPQSAKDDWIAANNRMVKARQRIQKIVGAPVSPTPATPMAAASPADIAAEPSWPPQEGAQPNLAAPAPAPTAVAPAAAPARAAIPFKEGALIRSKKDGKLYRVVNGQRVPLKDQ